MQLRSFCDDVARTLAFLGRLPVPDRFFVGYDGRLSRAVRAFPVAGLLLALPAGCLAAALSATGADPLLTALLALGLLTFLTGGLHDDGLADCMDGLGGGRDRDHALSIMKDHAIGSYGAVALILSFGLRVAALGVLLRHLTPVHAGMALVAAAVASRSAMVWHWQMLPPARSNGVASAAGVPDPDAARLAYIIGAALAVLACLPGVRTSGILLAAIACLAAVSLFTARIRQKIGGHTGDTIGAAQQIAEIATLCGLALSV